MGERARAAESASFVGERRRAEDACNRATSTGCPRPESSPEKLVCNFTANITRSAMLNQHSMLVMALARRAALLLLSLPLATTFVAPRPPRRAAVAAKFVPLAPADVASLLAPADVASQLPLVASQLPVAASQLPLVVASAAAAPPLALGPLVTKALGGGLSGASAGVVQVLSLMWLRTAMNYEYSNGGNSTVATVRSLYAEGGVPRLYRGVQYALVQSPLSRFGDAAANRAGQG